MLSEIQSRKSLNFQVPGLTSGAATHKAGYTVLKGSQMWTNSDSAMIHTHMMCEKIDGMSYPSLI